MEEGDQRNLASAGGLTIVGPRLSSSACEVRLEKRLDETSYGLNRLGYGGAIDSTHSLSYLSWVHARQLRRMETRSEWFLAPVKADSPSIADLKFASATLSRRNGPGKTEKENFQRSSTHSDVDDDDHSVETGNKGSIKRQRSWRKHYVRPNRSLDEERQQDSPLVVAVLIRRRSMEVSVEKAINHRTLTENNGSNKNRKGHLKLGRCQSNVETGWVKKK